MDSTKEYFTEEQRVLSFCYGYGGLEKGVNKIIPIKPIAYLEIEAFQNFNLVAAMESGLVDKAPIWTDIKSFDPTPFYNKVHGIIGGYPCQGESYAGKRKLWKDPRFLWPYIEQSIRTIKPIWCFFENVSGHLSGSFPYVLESLRNLGYKVEAGLFTASEVGAPHQRKRLFILAMDHSHINEFQKIRKTRLEIDGDILQGFQGKENPKRSNQTSQVLGNTSIERFKKFGFSSGPKKEFSESTFFGFDCFPSRPNKEQQSWEEPRTIKPSMGCTVNGYDFRTELLRQYGNGVVSQTAHKAFDNLLDIHLNNRG